MDSNGLILVTTAQAAKILNLSIQGVHYRIKHGHLKYIKKDNKIFIYIEASKLNTLNETKTKSNKTQEKPNIKKENISVEKTNPSASISTNNINSTNSNNNTNNTTYDALLKEKDAQVNILKRYLKLMRKQYENEILRLENNQIQTISVFKSEITLLQSAFNEMKKVYTIEHKNVQEKENNQNINTRCMDVKDFFLLMRKYNKSDVEIKNILLNRIRNNDKRFIYDSSIKNILIYESDFSDLT